MDSRLRFNLTFFKINNIDINLPVYDENWVATGFYQKGGNDERKGIEVELTGRILDNLEVITGYSYIDAQYKEHTSYVYGSAPLNTPKHTFNAYDNIALKTTLMVCLLVQEFIILGKDQLMTGVQELLLMKALSQTKNLLCRCLYANECPSSVSIYYPSKFQILLNNVFNEIGYNAYRTSYINQIDPRNFAGVLSYNF